MITFGYKNKINGVMRAVAALGIGIVMVAVPDRAMSLVVQIIAAFFIASGIVSFFYGLVHRKENALGILAFNAVVDVLIGVLLFCYPGIVATIIIYLIGIVLLFFGILQIVALIGASGILGFGFMAFILPVLVTLVGGFLLFNPFAPGVMSTIAGIALIVYGASELFSSWKMKKAIDEYEIKFSHTGTNAGGQVPVPDVKDVEFEKVDEQ